MKLLRLVSLAAVVMGLAFASQASANEVTWQGASSYASEGYSVGPYHLKVAGFNNNKTFDAACFRSDLEVNPPTLWQANVLNGAAAVGVNGWTEQQLRAGAYLYAQFKNVTPSNTAWGDIHHALWAVFQPDVVTGIADPYYSYKDTLATSHSLTGSGYSTAYTYYTTAMGSGGASVNLANYWFIVPTAGTIKPATFADGTTIEYTDIQPFVTNTPEPCSLALLGLGVAAAGIRRRRRKA